MAKPFTLYLIHHSHTDIGYTDYQEKIELHHVHYIKEAVEILRRAHGDRPEWLGFKWNCESLWCVETFFQSAGQKDREDFIRFVKSGEIGLSGSYLNMTELVSSDVLSYMTARAAKGMREAGLPLRSALTADVNGYAWGFADALYENGITRLLSCIHIHHGYHPLFQKQTPFYWETPKGHKLLAWVGEHYLLGNELGVAPGGAFEYTLRDGLDGAGLEPFQKAETRIAAYVETLRRQGHPFDLAPVNFSGRMTDNGSPFAGAVDFVSRYNALHGEEIRLQLATLDEFFDAVEAAGLPIPTYKGDWTDWWADGVGSTPNVVQHYREADRKYRMARRLDPEGKICGERLLDQTAYDLMFYAEHTWGYCSSVSEPWNSSVNNLDLRKSLFALKANESACRALDQITFSMGETPNSMHFEPVFKAVNPHPVPVTDLIRINAETLGSHRHFEIVDTADGRPVPHQLSSYARGVELNILAELEPGQQREYAIRELPAPAVTSAGRRAERGIEGVSDLAASFERQLEAGSVVTPYRLENRFFRMTFGETGVVSILDKARDKELVRPGRYAAFTPIYEVTPSRGDPCGVRRDMGRNRKSAATRRFVGKCCGVRVLEDGALFSRVELQYELEGCRFCYLILTAYKHTPRVDLAFRCQKDCVWDPENLYLALPFTTGGKETLWMDKTGCVFRPRVDQLPGTCVDFYAVQNGLCLAGEDASLLIGLPDTPLVTMGPLEAHEIKLCGEEGVENTAEAFAWVMNNFWET
ncbi:MAG: glycosyl hydrolase, partial [Clostridiales bacterium]|nr:glycosyl hydrolase [Clostridiales bacterium]